MIVYLNGEFLPEEKAFVSVSDRGFLYGDGVFETLRIFDGQPFRCEQHWERLWHTTQALGLPLSLDKAAFRAVAIVLAQRNEMTEAMFRFTISAGSGPRGYQRPATLRPTILGSLGTAPTGELTSPPTWRLVVARTLKISRQPLSGYKTCSRLLNVLARMEAASAGAHEALLLNEADEVTEGGASNVFCWLKSQLYTPPLESGALPGVTRAIVLELTKKMGIEVVEAPLTLEMLRQSEGVFVSVSSSGLVAAASLDGTSLQQSYQTTLLQEAYVRLVRQEIETELKNQSIN